MALAQQGTCDEAIDELKQAHSLSGGDPEILSLIGYTYAISGRHNKAQRVLDELRDLARQHYVSPYDIATVHTGLGERDQAFVWLEKAYEDRSLGLCRLKVGPRQDPLRSDPRFADLLRRIGL
jgi:Flp pilus assembly protein TadD